MWATRTDAASPTSPSESDRPCRACPSIRPRTDHYVVQSHACQCWRITQEGGSIAQRRLLSGGVSARAPSTASPRPARFRASASAARSGSSPRRSSDTSRNGDVAKGGMPSGERRRQPRNSRSPRGRGGCRTAILSAPLVTSAETGCTYHPIRVAYSESTRPVVDEVSSPSPRHLRSGWVTRPTSFPTRTTAASRVHNRFGRGQGGNDRENDTHEPGGPLGLRDDHLLVLLRRHPRPAGLARCPPLPSSGRSDLEREAWRLCIGRSADRGAAGTEQSPSRPIATRGSHR